MSKTLGLALGAGGTRGIAHVGFLKALEEAGIRPDYIAGSSMGSVVGACYSKGMTCDEMRDIAFQLKTTDILDVSLISLAKLGLLKSVRVRKLISGFLEDCTFEQLHIPFCCVAVDLKTAELKCFSEGSVVDAVLASSAMPSVFRPVEIDGMLLVDGGVLCRVPVKEVKKMGADVVVAVDVLGKVEKLDKVPNVLSLVTRVYDIMDCKRTQTVHTKHSRKIDLWLEPEMEDVSQYKVKNIEAAYEAGYRIGKENAEKIKELIAE